MLSLSRQGDHIMKTASEVGARIQALRTARGWRQEDLADRLRAVGYDILPATVSRAETIKQKFTTDELEFYAAAFGCDVSDLWPAAAKAPPQEAKDAAMREILRSLQSMVSV